MSKLIFHGHATFEILSDNGTRFLIDPFLTDNPQADVGPDHFDTLDYMFITHGHGDHVHDAWTILERTGAQLISSFEMVSYAQEVQNHDNGHPMSIGGGFNFPFGWVKMTIALHGAGNNAPDSAAYPTFPAGFLINIDGTTIYHAGDTALTYDMKLLKGLVDIALLPIGDNFTMGPEDAARAVKFIKPDVVIPCHYDTWPPIEQDPQDFADRVRKKTDVVVLNPGETHEF